jgi:hypothetical protein
VERLATLYARLPVEEAARRLSMMEEELRGVIRRVRGVTVEGEVLRCEKGTGRIREGSEKEMRLMTDRIKKMDAVLSSTAAYLRFVSTSERPYEEKL